MLGPLVIAGVAIRNDRIHELISQGVKDSKLLSPRTRERLYSVVSELAEKIVHVRIEPREIDRYVLTGKKLRRLNYLEAIRMGRLMRDLPADRYYVDASDVNERRFGRDAATASGRKGMKVVSSHHADRIFPVVSSASIIAKVKRDAAVEELRREYGDLGSGYPSDLKTRRFLKDWLEMKGRPPVFARRSWGTWKRISKRLDEFQ